MRKRATEYYFDEKAADRACRFFPKYLRHVKGRNAGEPFELSEWQKEKIIRPVFGWKKKKDHTRRYRKVYLEVPKGNGKSFLGSGIGAYMLFADGEPHAEIYSIAGDRPQAGIIFDAAKETICASEPLDNLSEIYRSTIVVPKTRSSWRVLSADAPTKHGYRPHLVLFDELHVQPNRHLWDAMSLSLRGRKQPLLVVFTTAGYDKKSICWEVHEYADKVARGVIVDPSFLPVIYCARDTDDWKSIETIKKANPNFGISLTLDDIEPDWKMAREVAAAENTFKRLQLNIWTQSAKRWISLDRWDASAGEEIKEEDFAGKECVGALDLASRHDIAAWVMLFRTWKKSGKDFHFFYHVVPRFFVPEQSMQERSEKDKVDYLLWNRLGLITATEGDEIDYGTIREQIFRDCEKYNVKEVCYDRWGAGQLIQELVAQNVKCVPVGMGFGSMAAPSHEIITLVRSKRLQHGGNPVLRWMADNMVFGQDPTGRLKPDKNKSTEKIDGMVAIIMALGRWTATDNAENSTANSTGELLVI